MAATEEIETAPVRHGGCLCGAVRYTVKWPPLLVATCHCRNCQKQAGSALSVVAFLKRDQLEVEGSLSVYEDVGATGDPVYRKFCGKCGSPVITETPSATAQGNIFIKAGTLDDCSDLEPSLHFWTKSAQPWFAFPSTGQCLETQ
jgi:hypothetical protein